MPKTYEDELQLLIDKVEGVDDRSWEDMVDELDLTVHPDSLRKSFSGGTFSGYAVAKYYQNKIKDNYCAEDEIERLELVQKELAKERIKLSDARREYKKELMTEARYENLVDVLRDGLCGTTELPQYKFGEKIQKELTSKYAILMLSDWHIGSLVNNIVNYYSIDVAHSRMQLLLDKVKKYILDLNITDMVIEINGDMIQGIINTSNRVQSEEDAVSQIIIASDMLAYFINELKPYLRDLKVVTTLGNHGRLIADKKAAINSENMEMLIPEFLRLKLDGIRVISSGGLDFVRYEFADRDICLAHGQNDNINHVIEDFVKIYKIVPDEIHLGHTHAYKDINDCNIYITVNGSLMGSDEYATNIRKATKPSQNLIVYGEDRGVYELILDLY